MTTDGVPVHFGANVESLADVSRAVAAGAEPIGARTTSVSNRGLDSIG